ncbi:MAG: hypothetical protein V3W14_05225 [Candidatus Neomarinimicrobiota bacterium]
MKSNFVICVNNEGYEASLELRKVYRAMEDKESDALDHIRIIDESGEDYVYPSDYFMGIDLPKPVEEAISVSPLRFH